MPGEARLMITTSLVLLLTLFTVGCETSESPAVVTHTPDPVAVIAVEVASVEWVEPVLGTGTVAAAKTTNVGPRVDGIIEEIAVQVGDRVEAAAPLFTTRQVHYHTRVKEAESALRRARAEARKAHGDVEDFEDLQASGVIAQDDLDTARTQVEIAEGRLGEVEAALDHARQELEDTVVRAPYAGVVTKRYVDEGTMLRTMTMSEGTHVVQIMKTDVVLAIVQVPEMHLAQIHVGTRARVQLDGMGQAYDSFIYILNDRVDPNSRAVEVRLPIKNPDLAIKPGLFAKAELFPEARTVLVVDRRAVLGSESNQWVYAAVDGKAARRAVRVRELDAQRVEVLAGLAVGERVLAGPGLARLAEGTPVALELAHADR